MKTTKYALAAISLVFLVVPTAARADEIYQFSINAAGGISAFSFSFTAPTFVADLGSPAFTPFTLTDGTNMWTMVQDLACNGRFNFVTSGSALSPSCAASLSPTNAGFLAITVGSPPTLPTAVGSYVLGGTGLFYSGSTLVHSNPQWTGTLTISTTPSPVPEPSSLILLGTGLLGLVGAVRRKWLA